MKHYIILPSFENYRNKRRKGLSISVLRTREEVASMIEQGSSCRNARMVP
jgi:DNA repair photolyase